MAAPETTDLWQGEELLPVTKSSSSATCCKTVNNNSKTEGERHATSDETSRIISNALKQENMSLVDTLSHQVRILLKHFQGPDPIGLPGQHILPEPLAVSDTNASFGIATGMFSNISVWGLSNFTISVINTNLDDMEVCYSWIIFKKVSVL